MQNVYKEVTTLDKRCYHQFGLNEDILMENAASNISSYIQKHFKPGSRILVVCGPGNNGADGIVVARQLHLEYCVDTYIPFGAKSQMAKIQLDRANNIEIDIIESLHDEYDVVVDCLFGSGLNKQLDDISVSLLKILNSFKAFKIACDIPSGIDSDGMIVPVCFKADMTITMGAHKTQLYSDGVKDHTGDVIVGNLGVSRQVYETPTNIFLLDKEDMRLPYREKSFSHKGDFGHLNVILGEKLGAGILCSEAAFVFGVGLLTTIGHKDIQLPSHLMQGHQVSSNVTAIAIGMGLGNHDDKEVEDILQIDVPKVIDADLFYDKKILGVLERTDCVLTPHPKEFCALLKLCGIADISVQECQNNRFDYVGKFTKKYPDIVLLLKGVNTLIAYREKIYINTFGSSVLSQGGSGDVLSGLIGSLLAQGYKLLDATITASLTHSIAAQNYDKNDYSMLPEDLIEQIKVVKN